MSELTYKQKLRDRVREAKEQEVVEFKKTDEPDYTAFFDAVQTVFVRPE